MEIVDIQRIIINTSQSIAERFHKFMKKDKNIIMKSTKAVENDEIKFTSEVKTVQFGKNRTIRIENLTPVLTEQERKKRKREIEIRLFDVFKKYD